MATLSVMTSDHLDPKWLSKKGKLSVGESNKSSKLIGKRKRERIVWTYYFSYHKLITLRIRTNQHGKLLHKPKYQGIKQDQILTFQFQF